MRLELRGQRLGLRGPLPCRRGSGRHPVQRISLGLPADESGLRQAQQQLRKLVQQLQQQRFQWSEWGQSNGLAAAPVVGGLTGRPAGYWSV